MQRKWERQADGRFVHLCFDREGGNVRLQRAASYGNVSGYGPRQPTDWEVRIGSAWRRVYCAIYGNAGTCYIRHAGHEFIVDI